MEKDIIKSIPEPKNDKQYGGVLLLLGFFTFVSAVLILFGSEEAKQVDETI